MSVTAIAHPNIALTKYWGKADKVRNIPATPSLSVTLDQLESRTRVSLLGKKVPDRIKLNGQPVNDAKIQACIDRMRTMAGTDTGIEVDTSNNFPTAAGLASSASGFAALVTALDAALDTQLSIDALSEQARLGSASAARSLFGGFAALAGEQAWQLAPAAHWPLSIVVAVCARTAKATSSSQGMQLSADTSPLYDRWVRTAQADFEAACRAVDDRNFELLGNTAEHSCLKMHAVMLSSNPALIYWNAATMACMQAVRELREAGVPVFFTIDAGPQLKAICLPEAEATVAARLAEQPGVDQVLRAHLGPGPAVYSD
jgi:diphosphomevalonate decarboxylase